MNQFSYGSRQDTLADVIYRFQPFELDLRVYQLRKRGETLPIQRKVFDVLRYLIEHRDRVVSKEELLASVWPDEVVSESAIHRNVSHVRQLLDQHGKAGTPIETVHGRGYRFRGDVEIVQDVSAMTWPSPELVRAALPQWHRGSAGEATSHTVERRFGCAPRRAGDEEPFVGRDRPLQRLREAFARAEAGSGSMFVLAGEPGIGKTRCVEVFAAEARARGASVWKARCSELEGSPELWPWVQILRAYAAELAPNDPTRADALALIEELAPELAPNPAPHVRVRDGGASFRLLDRLTRFVLELSAGDASQVRLIWLDDLSCTASTSLDILSLLSPALGQRRLLLLITERADPSSVADASSHLLPDGAQRIELAGLTASEIQSYLELMLGPSASSELASRVLRMTGGNPMFVREVLRAWSGGPPEHDELRPLPSALQTLLARRLRGLPLHARSLLDLASVVGETFELALIERAAARPSEEMLVSLDATLRAGLIERSPDGSFYRFHHGLIRDAIYESLSAGARSSLHLQVATALEAHAVDSSSTRALALHYHRALPAGSPAKTREYACRAARSYAAAGAFQEAAQLMRCAMSAQEFEPELRPRERCSLLLETALNENRAGRIHDARRLLVEVIDLAMRHEFADVLAYAGIVLRPRGVAVATDALARRALDAANASLPPEKEALRARVLSRLSWTPPYAYDRLRRREMAAEARRLAPASDASSRGDALLAVHGSCSAPEDLLEAQGLNPELEQLCIEQPGTALAYDARLCRIETFLRMGDMASAVREVDLLGRTAREIKYPEAIWTHQRLDLQTSFYEADLAQVESALRQLYSSSQEYRIRFGRDYACVCESRLRRERGVGLDPPILDAATQGRARSMLDEPAMPAVRAWVLREAAENGNSRHARAELARLARSGFTDQPRDAALLATLAELSLAAVALRDHDAAERLAEQMRPFASHVALDGFLFSWGCVAYYVGNIALLLDRRDEAVELLELARELNARMSHRPALARTELALGALWLEDASRATRQEGVTLLRSVREQARDAGMLAISEAAAKKLATAGIVEPS